MNFCSGCGATVALKAVDNDSRERYVCTECGKTHYQNPRVLVACYACVGDRMLWIKRGIPPAQGKWAMPGGFMENDETPEAAAARELMEETGIAVSADDMMLVSVSSILHMTQTHLVFRCHLDEFPDTTETDEASAFGWFDEDSLPWGDVAFPTIEPQVRQMYRWLRSGNYGIRIGFIDESGSHYKHYRLAN